MLATLEAVRELLTLSPQLEDRFLLSIVGQKLKLAPKAGKDSGFLEAIELNFRANLAIESMQMKTADDTTTLTFESFAMDVDQAKQGKR